MDNGGAGLHYKVWKYKMCAKQVSGQTVPLMLEETLGEDWKTRVRRVAGLQHTDVTNIRKRDRTQTVIDEKNHFETRVISNSHRTWEKMVKAFEGSRLQQER